MSPIPIPVPIASPALHASEYSSFGQVSDAALTPAINQMTNKTCTARMTQVSGRHDGMVDLLCGWHCYGMSHSPKSLANPEDGVYFNLVGVTPGGMTNTTHPLADSLGPRWYVPLSKFVHPVTLWKSGV